MPAGELIASDSRLGLDADAAGALVAQGWAVLGEVMDPEVPVVSVVDLGIVRSIDWHAGQLRVVVTPTYSGCPATEYIERCIAEALQQAGLTAVAIETRLHPAWTTDWISVRGRQQLQQFGIAPPQGRADSTQTPVVPCPQCGSTHTEQVSEFGSTACKALYRCSDCLEPFDYFKCI
jgi:ring-1,2-phenylacetyl-CoA epoxidase subunit PaaD